ncbi:MAG: hypothetical protein PHY92_02760 [Alphaproteobacteria bacterium]|nr:hypothetical protein [Alphaproteobacteria bacterium]
MALKHPRLSKHVTRHWLYDQIASAVFIPLSLYALVTFFVHVVKGNPYTGPMEWLRSAPNGVMVILFLAVAIFYKAGWLITIIQDYVHDPKLNRGGILAVKIFAWILAFAGIASVLKIMWGD